MAYRSDKHPFNATSDNRQRARQSGACNHSRREVLSTLAALGVSAFVPGAALIAQTSEATKKSGLIDVHHHILPPVYLAEARDRLLAQQQGYLPARILNWSPQNALAEMDQNGVATSIVSTSPQVFGSGMCNPRALFPANATNTQHSSLKTTLAVLVSSHRRHSPIPKAA